MKLIPVVAAICFLIAGCRPSFFQAGLGSASKLQKAEELSRQGRYDEAIEAYRAHMQTRLNYTGRPKWENPYFYLILIGDIQLGQNKVEEAFKSYQAAEENGVDPYLISDRYRSIASWYEKQNQLAKAIDFLSRYRSRDPILIDAMLDRLAKQLVKQEEAAALNPTAAASPAPAS